MALKAYMLYFAFAQTILSLLLVSVLIFRRKTHRGAPYLVLLIILLSLKQLVTVDILANPSKFIQLTHYLRGSIAFLIGPLMYSYIARFVNADFTFFSRKNILLYCYSLILLIVSTIFRISQSSHNVAITPNSFVYSSLVLGLLVQIPCLILIGSEISVFHQKLKENFSDNLVIHTGWLRFISVIISISVGFRFADILFGPDITLWKYSPILSLSVIFALCFYSIVYSKVFYWVTSEMAQNSPNKTSKALSEEEKEKYKIKILEYLKNERPYLNPDFSLKDLSDAIGLKSYRTSEIISKGFESNFYKMLNDLRVEHAQKILIDPKYSHLNMLGIASECGFNSKSVFNDAFKKITLKTPSEYRETALAK